MGREKFEQLKAGSEAYNRDVADIKWLISTLKGIMEEWNDDLRYGFSFNTKMVLAETGASEIDVVEIEFELTPWRKVSVYLKLADKSIPWDAVKWSPSPDGDVRPFMAARMAENLDVLLNEFIKRMFRECNKAYKTIWALLNRGQE